MDRRALDTLFDVAMEAVGMPPFTSRFDTRVLLPLDMLPDLVERECGETFEVGRAAEVRSAGWFRVLEHDGGMGVPLYVASRIGLFLKLEAMGYRHHELREFAEFEDEMVENVYAAAELAYVDDDVELLIGEHELRLLHAENSLRAAREPGWVPDTGPVSSGGDAAVLAEEIESRRRSLQTLRRYRENGLPEAARMRVARAAYHVRQGNELARIMMLEADRVRVAAGFSFFISFEGGFAPWPSEDGFDPPFPIDWQSTVRRPWFAEEPNRRVFLPGLIIEGDEVRMTSPLPPPKYDELWRLYGLDAFFRERASMLAIRLCLNCLGALDESADPRRRYCSEACRNAAKQRRFRKNNPRRDLEHKRRYYSSLPELE